MGLTLNTQVTTETPVVTTTETVVATLSGVTTPRPGCKVILTGMAQFTTGTATTALTPRIRRGTAITDPVVGEGNPQQVQAAAGSTETVDLQVEDTPGEVAGQSYVLTVQQTAATGNGSCLLADLKAEVVF